MKSIDYDVDLDFLLNSPKTPAKPVNGVETLEQSDSLQNPVQAKSAYDVDCLITPNRPGTVAVDRSAKVPSVVPSVDRSTKPSSSLLNNSVPDTAANPSQPATSVAHSSNKLTSDKNVDPSNDISDSRSLKKPGQSTVDPSTRSSIPPFAPDRSTKPVPPAISSSDVSSHSAKLEKEQAELNILQAKKRQEADALANLMREKKKMEIDMEKENVSAHSTNLEKEQTELNILQAKKMQEASALANLMREKRKLETEIEKEKRLGDIHRTTK